MSLSAALKTILIATSLMLQSRTWLDVGRCHARMVGLFMSRTARDGCDLAGIL